MKRLIEWWMLLRHLPDITRLASMSDEMFAAEFDRLREHPSVEFRAICAARWAHTTFPNHDREEHIDTAWAVWGTRKAA